MEPLLGRGAAGPSAAAKRNWHVAAAAVAAVAIFAAFVTATLRIESALHWAPTAVPLLPAAAVACLATVLPLLVFVGSADEFSGVNPVTPSGYALVARRTYAAFGGSATTGGRVSGKDL